MPIPGIRFGTTRQEGDDTFVTFFLVLLIAVILIGSVLVAPRNSDEMISMVPRSAVLYAHASGEAVARLSPMMPATISGLTPDEVGIFAVQSVGQEGLDWGYLLKWNSESPDELSSRYPVLADLPRREGDRIFVLADTAAARSMELVRLGGSLSDDDSVSSSLRQVRSFSKNQMYVQPAGTQALFAAGDSRPDKPQIVLWRDVNRLVFAPLGDINPGVSGLAVPLNRDVYQGPEWADLSVIGNVREAKTVLVDLILGPNWSKSGAVTVLSGNRLMGMLSDADYLAVGSPEKTNAGFLVHINGNDDQTVKSSLLEYFATKKPVMRGISMPDGEIVMEMALDSAWLSFVPRGEGYEVLSTSEDDIQIPPYTVFNAESNGFWLADSPERLQERPEIDFGETRKFCLKGTENELKSWFVGNWLSGKELCIEEVVDKSVVIYSNY